MANRETFRNCKLIFRNFAGKETQYNMAGKRNFSILIEDEAEANRLIADGWNVKKLKEKPDVPPAWHLKVNVRFDVRPPKVRNVTTVNGRQKCTDMSEQSISSLDWMEIEKADLTIVPYNYSKGAMHGTTAYLETMYVTPVVNELDAEYDFSYDEEEIPFE